nr:hypothetical protein GCM10023233_26040 [Brevibacterium otitidis]
MCERVAPPEGFAYEFGDVIEALRVLGIDPRYVTRVVIEPRAVTVTEHVPDHGYREWTARQVRTGSGARRDRSSSATESGRRPSPSRGSE